MTSGNIWKKGLVLGGLVALVVGSCQAGEGIISTANPPQGLLPPPTSPPPVVSTEWLVEAPLPDLPAPRDQGAAAVAFGGGIFLVVWSDTRQEDLDNEPGDAYGRADLFGIRLTSDGEVLDPEPFLIARSPDSEISPALAFDGNRFFVVWTRSSYIIGGMSFCEGDIYGTRVEIDGTVVDPEGILLSPAPGQQVGPAVASAGNGFVVVWTDIPEGQWCSSYGDTEYDIAGTRVSTTGTIEDLGGFQVADTPEVDESTPKIAASGDGYLVAWSEATVIGLYTERSVKARRIDSSGAMLDDQALTIGPPETPTWLHSLSTGPGHWLVVWSVAAGDDGERELLAGRIDTSGNSLDTTGVALPTDSWSTHLTSAAFDGEAHVIVVSQSILPSPSPSTADYRISVARLSPTDLEPIAPHQVATLITERARMGKLAVAPDGTAVLVYQSHADFSPTMGDVYTKKLDPSGLAKPGIPRLLSTGWNEQRDVAVGFNGTSYLAAWQDTRNGMTSGVDLRGTRLTAMGETLAPDGFPVSTLPGDEACPAIAANEDIFLIAWRRALPVEEGNAAPTAFEIRFARVTAMGEVLDPDGRLLSTDVTERSCPAVGELNGTFLVAWPGENALHSATVDSASGTATLSPAPLVVTSGLFGTRPAIATDEVHHYVFAMVAGTSSLLPDTIGMAAVDEAGAPISPGWLPLTPIEGYAVDRGAIDASFLADRFLVVYEASERIYGLRIDPAGTLLDAAALPLGDPFFPAFAPRVSTTGSDWLVTWSDGRREELSRRDIYGTRVSAVTDSGDGDGYGFPLSNGPGNEEGAASAPGADRFLLLYEKNEPTLQMARRIAARWVCAGDEDCDVTADETLDETDTGEPDTDSDWNTDSGSDTGWDTDSGSDTGWDTDSGSDTGWDTDTDSGYDGEAHDTDFGYQGIGCLCASSSSVSGTLFGHLVRLVM